MSKKETSKKYFKKKTSRELVYEWVESNGPITYDELKVLYFDLKYGMGCYEDIHERNQQMNFYDGYFGEARVYDHVSALKNIVKPTVDGKYLVVNKNGLYDIKK